jgi:hypothetical protein
VIMQQASVFDEAVSSCYFSVLSLHVVCHQAGETVGMSGLRFTQLVCMPKPTAGVDPPEHILPC